MKKNIIIHGKQWSGKSTLVNMLTGKFHPREIVALDTQTLYNAKQYVTEHTKVIVIEGGDADAVNLVAWAPTIETPEFTIEPFYIFIFQDLPDGITERSRAEYQVIETTN